MYQFSSLLEYADYNAARLYFIYYKEII